jgi:hypothetical protein
MPPAILISVKSKKLANLEESINNIAQSMSFGL